jgi:hypothetical protein
MRARLMLTALLLVAVVMALAAADSGWGPW